MAMITCPECGRKISEYAPACVGCGVPMEMIKKLLAEAESEPSPTAVAADAEIREESAQVQTTHAEAISVEQMKSRMVNCIICGTNFDIADHHCPKCNYYVLSLSPKPDLNAITELKTKYRDESDFDLKQPLLTRVYSYDEYLQLYKKRSSESSDYLAKKYNQYAERDNIYAKANLGMLHLAGYGVKRDFAIAVKLLRETAESGLNGAQFWLGVLHTYGQGVEKNLAKAAEWYRKAAEQGHVEAQYKLGNFYANGKGVKQAYTKAAEWYQKAAEQGHAEAQNNLGGLYERGEGVKQDYTKAAEWYQKAAEQNHAEAQYKLGVLYENGKGREYNLEIAIKWYRKAAEQGHVEARIRLIYLL